MNISLYTPISKISRLDNYHINGLKKLKIENILDLLYYFPIKYLDEREMENICNLKKGETKTIFGQIKDLKIKRSFRGHIPMCEAKLFDNSGHIKLIWFHQPYIAKMYNENEFVKVSGLIQEKNNKLTILNPNIEKANASDNLNQESIFNLENENKKKLNQELIPIYRETKGITSNFLNHILKKCIKEYKILNIIKNENLDPIPEKILKELNLPSLEKAFLYIHFPKSQKDFDAKKQIVSARKRFSFQEIFFIQMEKQKERELAKNSFAYSINTMRNFSDTKKTKTKNEDIYIVSDFISKIENKYNFKLTNSQLSAIKNILNSLNKNEPMGRLLEGDVGSGKTLIAAAISYVITHDENRVLSESSINNNLIKKRLQVAYMAPTEILAKQHFESFINYFSDLNIEIGLITGKSCYKYPSKIKDKKYKTNEENYFNTISKEQLKKQIESGEISIIIGTHALIQKNILFNNLAFVIIDEQHKFGVKQRAALAQKKSNNIKILPANDLQNTEKFISDNINLIKENKFNKLKNKSLKIISEKKELPHLLSMTATPIPRTLALTIFGDLDLTIIDEMPKNRKKILTKIVFEKERKKIYEEIKKEIESGYQVYVICPRIDELDEEEMQNKNKLNLRSVASEIKNLKNYFPNSINIVGIHSKLKKEEKENIMKDFSENKIQILVSTSVIEVGVNVPNASRMIIEGAERFGLAQLHQLRGRIGRGERESICYLFITNEKSCNDITIRRLKILETAKNGFELAEKDMMERGVGTLQNGKQWGMSDLAMEAIKNLKLVEIAREYAKKIVLEDINLEKLEHKNLRDILNKKEKIHME